MNIFLYQKKITVEKFESMMSQNIFSYAILIVLSSIPFVIFLGNELYAQLIILSLIYYSVSVLIYPQLVLFLILLISIFIEGQTVEALVLFRFLNFNWYLMDFVLLITYTSISIRLLSGKFKFRLNAIHLALSFFYIAMIISVFVGIKNGHMFNSIFYDVRGFFYYIMFIPAIYLLDDFRQLKYFFFLLIAFGMLKSGIDIVRSFFFLPVSFDDTTQNYLPFARLKGYSEIVYPMTAIGSLILLFFTTRILSKIFLILASLLSLCALFLSYSRGSWITMIVSLIFAIIIMVVKKEITINAKWIGAVASSLAVIIAISFFSGMLRFEIFLMRLFSINLNSIDISNLGRLVEYSTAFEAFLINPLYGSGLGYIFNYFAPGIGNVSTIYCHNSYLYILSKMGLLGILPFMMIIFLVVKININIFSLKSISREEKGIVFSLMVIFLFISIKSLTTWHLNTVTFSMFVGILIGIASMYKSRV